MDLRALIEKYAKPGPRYTSYPTAPQWTEAITAEDYQKHLSETGEPSFGLYVHVPYCESLCYYCGCNIQITHEKNRGKGYVRSLLNEFTHVTHALPQRPKLTQISWGGGTPTFLSAELLETLFHGIQDNADIADNAEISIEVDPRVTTDEQLQRLRELGFNRISLGVQDFNPEVQKAVNRVQPAEATHAMLLKCTELGYTGINFDLIYGLPHQSFESFSKTIRQVIEMKPSRIALYNYARLPKMIPHQTILEKFPMPTAEDRIELFTYAHQALKEAGYVAIGMDHFALAEDELAKALTNGTLYRNFMGYTVKRSTELLGIGVSAISELSGAYFQNKKQTKDYQATVDKGKLATHRGFVLSQDDQQRKWAIQNLMCRFKVNFKEFEASFHTSMEEDFSEELKTLDPFFEEALLEKQADGFGVTEQGRLFVRNIAMKFDAYLKQKPTRFSQTV